MEFKSIEEWEKIFDIDVIDADGFPKNTDRKNTLFSEKEFLYYCNESTIKMGEKVMNKIKRSDVARNPYRKTTTHLY